MPKIKTRRSAAKRFEMTGSGKYRRHRQNLRHILTKKPTKRTRNLRKAAYLNNTEGKTMKKLIPYK